MKRPYHQLFALCLIILCGMVSSAAHAQKLHKTYDNWRVFTYKKLCYTASLPIKKAGNYTKRGEPFLMVTYRKKVTDEVSAGSGYPYKKSSKVIAKVDGEKEYKLFTQKNRAWAFDEAQDKSMIYAMKMGSKITIRGTSTRGTYSSDTYSLKGFTNALKHMRKICR